MRITLDIERLIDSLADSDVLLLNEVIELAELVPKLPLNEVIEFVELAPAADARCVDGKLVRLSADADATCFSE